MSAGIGDCVETTDILASVRRLLVAYQRLDAAWRQQFGLNPNERLVLLFLAEGTVAPTELSRAVGMTTAGMTGLLDRLEAEGFLRRQRHASDGRRVIVALTKKGLRAHLAFEEATQQMVDASGELSDAERATVAGFLERAAAATDVAQASPA